MNPEPLARLIQQQVLQADASRGDVEKACAEARAHGFHSVCVNGSRVSFAAARLEESEVKLAAVVGFPSGTADADAKRYETEVAIDNGAQEINTVINLGWLKDGEDSAILRELRDIVEAADERPVGVIVELPLLSPAEKARACQLIVESAAKSLIASAGFGSGEPSVEEIKILRRLLGDKLSITAAGIIHDPQSAQALIEAGATRLATCAGVRLLRSVDSRV